eukprot:5163671-Ditylum_brightwellii.AAC.1
MAYVYKLLKEGKPTTRQNINSLKTLGLTECKTKNKIFLSNKRKSNSDNKEYSSSSDSNDDNEEKVEGFLQYELEVKITGKITED